MVEKIARERRAPVLEHAHESAARDLRRHILLEGERQAQAVHGGANHEIGVVEDERSAHIDDDGLTLLLELPAIGPGGTAAKIDASVAEQVVG